MIGQCYPGCRVFGCEACACGKAAVDRVRDKCAERFDAAAYRRPKTCPHGFFSAYYCTAGCFPALAPRGTWS